MPNAAAAVDPPVARTGRAKATRGYVPRRPHDTVLHRLVREHLATFIAHSEATYEASLPR